MAIPHPITAGDDVATTSVTPAATAAARPVDDALVEAFGREQDHEDEDPPEDDLAPVAEPRVREALLQGVDDDGADDGPEPVPPPPEHGHHDDEQRHGEVEDALRRQIADLERRGPDSAPRKPEIVIASILWRKVGTPSSSATSSSSRIEKRPQPNREFWIRKAVRTASAATASPRR